MADVERSGRHAAPRHPAPGTGSSSGPAAEPARLDAGLLPAGRAPAPAPDGGRVRLLVLALGITTAVVAWGYLVYLAIDVGTDARNGDSAGWWLLGLSTVGAIACLFVALLLGARIVVHLRAESTAAGSAAPPRPPGGRRAAR